jgi:hypothetical protein
LRAKQSCEVTKYPIPGIMTERIIDSLEPLLNQHRLVFEIELVRREVERALDYSTNQRTGHKNNLYSLFHQFTRITSAKQSLKHDDKLDVLAIACKYWTDSMSQSDTKQAQRIKDDMLTESLKGFVSMCRGDEIPFKTRKSKGGLRGKRKSTWIS